MHFLGGKRQSKLGEGGELGQLVPTPNSAWKIKLPKVVLMPQSEAPTPANEAQQWPCPTYIHKIHGQCFRSGPGLLKKQTYTAAEEVHTSSLL